jgi:hypothetical protein
LISIEKFQNIGVLLASLEIFIAWLGGMLRETALPC